jgi:hypothetical protein
VTKALANKSHLAWLQPQQTVATSLPLMHQADQHFPTTFRAVNFFFKQKHKNI